MLGNIPHDISGIITGFPAAIAHTVAHLPSEISNTGELLYHLADGDQTWLKQKGYLQATDSLHGSWSDFGTILRAMDRNGDKQLLPYIPFVADLANMTSSQGRTLLMQHPIGALLDVLPGVAKVGKMSMAGRDLSVAAEVGKGEPRFYAAGRALQAGNPLKAVVSAVGDIIPAGKDDFLAPMTLRKRANLAAKAAGVDRFTREGLIRPFEEATTQLEFEVNQYVRDKFGDPMWRNLTPARAHYLYLGSHLVNPDTGEVFKTLNEYNTWRRRRTPG